MTPRDRMQAALIGGRKKRKRRVATRANSNHARNLAPPEWVMDVVAEVRRLYGVPSKRLLILWRRSPAAGMSSGHTKVRAGEIVITAGSCEFDQGDTLLHELAHWLCRPETHHKQRFWLTYWRLVRYFGLDEQKCLARSVVYRSRAELAYAKERAS